MVNEKNNTMREKSSNLEKTMSPLILLYRLGNKKYHPEIGLPEESRCEFGKFKNDIVEALWNCDGKITPKEYLNIVRGIAIEEAKRYEGSTPRDYFTHILEQTVLGHIHKLDLGEWGKDLLGIYSQNLCNLKLVS